MNYGIDYPSKSGSPMEAIKHTIMNRGEMEGLANEPLLLEMIPRTDMETTASSLIRLTF